MGMTLYGAARHRHGVCTSAGGQQQYRMLIIV